MRTPVRRLLTLTTISACVLILMAARADSRTFGPAAIVCPAFKQGCSYALRIASCETGGTFDPRSRGKAGERGWFQIHPIHFGTVIRSSVGAIRVDRDRLYDPAYNTRVAYVLSNGGRDWRPWSCRRYVG